MQPRRGTRAAHGPLVLLAAGLALLLLAGCAGSPGPVEHLRARLDLKQGNLSYLRGDYKLAIAHYDDALRHVPDLAAAHLNRAYGFVALFRAAETPDERKQLAAQAVESFEKYLSVLEAKGTSPGASSPDRDRIEQHILTLYLDSQQQDLAVQFLQQRLQRNPHDVPALQLLSTIEADKGDIAKALEYQHARLEIEPNSPEAWYALGVFAWQTSYRQRALDPAQRDSLLEDGLRAIRRALELRPDYFEALSYANLLYRQKAQYSDREEDRRRFEARADSLRSRALEVRKATQAESSKAGGSSSPPPAPSPRS
jgi:tetratricopeptide (TPR) repeat protein